MSSFRMIQISDPHLSRERPLFYFNWDLVVGWINEAKPDLVVCTGDFAFNAIASLDDLAFAREQFDRLDVPWLAVPGNHDVGNNHPDVRGEHVASSEHVAAYRRYFGTDFWQHAIGGWTFIGLDCLILGSGLPEEREQLKFLRKAIAGAAGTPIALFMHKPLFLVDPDDERRHQGSLFAEPRRALMEEIAGADIRLVATGHNHELVQADWGPAEIVWCPATSFTIVSGAEPRGGGERVPGYLDYRFEGGNFEVTPVLPKEMLRIDIGTWLQDGIGLYDRFTSQPWPTPRTSA